MISGFSLQPVLDDGWSPVGTQMQMGQLSGINSNTSRHRNWMVISFRETFSPVFEMGLAYPQGQEFRRICEFVPYRLRTRVITQCSNRFEMEAVIGLLVSGLLDVTRDINDL